MGKERCFLRIQLVGQLVSLLRRVLSDRADKRKSRHHQGAAPSWIETLEDRRFLSATPWTQRGGNAGHTGFVDVTVDTSRMTSVWSRTIQLDDGSVGGGQMNAVAVDSMRIYRTERAANGSGFGLFSVMAFNRLTGEEVWRTPIQGGAHDGVGEPTVVDGVVYVNRSGHSGGGGVFPTLFALDAATGAVIDSQNFSAQWGTNERPAVSNGHIVFEDGYYGGISSFSQATLDRMWAGSAVSWSEVNAAIDDEYAYAFGAYAYRLSDGTRSPLPKPVGFTSSGFAMVSQTGRVLVELSGNYQHCIAAYDGDTHARLWTCNLPGTIACKAVGQGLIAAVSNSRMHIIDEATGTIIRSWQVADSTQLGEIILTRNAVFLQQEQSGPSGKKEVVAYSLQSGALLWSHKTDWAFLKIAMAGDDLLLSGPGTIELISNTKTQQPVVWAAADDAVRYDIWFSQVAPTVRRLSAEANLLSNSYTIPQELSAGVYRYWTRTVNASGQRGAWSSLTDFEVRPTAIAPVGSTFSRRPTFSWEAVPGATSYQLFLRTSQGDIVQTGITGTSWTPETDLPREKIKWWVRYDGAISNKGWSLPQVIDTTGVTEILPGSGVPTSFRVLSWRAVDGASRYILHIVDQSGLVYFRKDDLMTTSYTPLNSYPKGTYRAWVKAIDSTNSFNSGIWSKEFRFTI